MRYSFKVHFLLQKIESDVARRVQHRSHVLGLQRRHAAKMADRDHAYNLLTAIGNHTLRHLVADFCQWANTQAWPSEELNGYPPVLEKYLENMRRFEKDVGRVAETLNSHYEAET